MHTAQRMIVEPPTRNKYLAIGPKAGSEVGCSLAAQGIIGLEQSQQKLSLCSVLLHRRQALLGTTKTYCVVNSWPVTR